MNTEVITSIVRALLMFVLGAVGVNADQGTVIQIASALSTIVILGWSVFAASKRDKVKMDVESLERQNRAAEIALREAQAKLRDVAPGVVQSAPGTMRPVQ